MIAAGGLSIPTLGASAFAYRVAEQFGLKVLPTRAGLVPFTLPPELLAIYSQLSGLSCNVSVSAGNAVFREPLLFTHRGLSGPSILQASSYWHPGETVEIDLLPGTDAAERLKAYKRERPNASPASLLGKLLPKRLAASLVDVHGWQQAMQAYSDAELGRMGVALNRWQLMPAGTEGYRTAEVTLGGIETTALSSKTFAVNDQPNLYFIGEALDVSGHLGGHNFQWAWASGHCAGQAV